MHANLSHFIREYENATYSLHREEVGRGVKKDQREFTYSSNAKRMIKNGTSDRGIM